MLPSKYIFTALPNALDSSPLPVLVQVGAGGGCAICSGAFLIFIMLTWTSVWSVIPPNNCILTHIA